MHVFLHPQKAELFFFSFLFSLVHPKSLVIASNSIPGYHTAVLSEGKSNAKLSALAVLKAH